MAQNSKGIRSLRGKQRAISGRLLAAMALGCCAGAPAANAIDVAWLGTGSSLFNLAANWNPAQIPAAADVAIFNNNLANGTVAFNGPATVSEMSFRNVSGKLTLDFGLNAVSAPTRYVVGTAAGETNDITFSNGTFTHTGTFGIGSSGSHLNKVTVSGVTTTLISTNTSSAVIGPANSNDNQLVITSGAYYQLQSNVLLGALTSTGNRFDIVNGGRLEIRGGNRGLTINQGTLTVTNAYADCGLITATASTSFVNFNSGTLLARRTTVANGLPFVVGDAGTLSATFGMHSSAPTCSFANGMVLNSNGRLIGSGTITGSVSGVAGAKVNPSSLGIASSTFDDANFGTLGVTGDWKNTGIELTLDVGDFPTKLTNTTTPPFVPPNNSLIVGGAFTHGGTVNIDMYDYVPPQDQDYSLRVIGFAGEVGVNTSSPVTFVNGGALAYQWQADGLYVTAAKVTLPLVAWAFDGSGNWSDGTKWASAIPDGVDSVVALGNTLTGPATVSLDSARTIGKVTISGSNNYTIDGSSTLTFDVDKISTARIQATSGSGTHTIVPPIHSLDNMCINVGSTTLLTTSGTLSVAGKELRKIGPGTLAVGKVNVGALTLSDGIVKLTGNQTVSGVLEATGFSITTAAKLDIGNAAVVVNPASGDLTPEIRAAITTGRRAGLWNGLGITSSHAAANSGFAVGYARGSDMGVGTIFGSIPVDGDTVVIRETYVGDSNLDGKVNTVDFNLLAGGFGNPASTWVRGDYDYDGDVDSIDFTSLAANYGKSLPSPAATLGTVVPEPVGASVVALAMLAGLGRRRSIRK